MTASHFIVDFQIMTASHFYQQDLCNLILNLFFQNKYELLYPPFYGNNIFTTYLKLWK